MSEYENMNKGKPKQKLSFPISPCFQSAEKLQAHDENNVDMFEKRKEAKELEEKVNYMKGDIYKRELECGLRGHKFPDKPVYDPADDLVPGEFLGYEKNMGVDAQPMYNWVKVKKDRWSRTCAECGKKEYTETLGIPKDARKVPIF